MTALAKDHSTNGRARLCRAVTLSPAIELLCDSLTSLCSLRPLRLIVFLIFGLVGCNGFAQVQQAWVAHYNNGIPNGTNQAVKMLLDSAGNIYITGFSQNTNGNLDYATIKYAPNGTQVWTVRFDSTNTTSAIPAGMILDPSNNVLLTGSAGTLKYDPNGNQLWTAPYAGMDLASDTNGNICVVGYSLDFGVVKLTSTGSNVWTVTSDADGPALSQKVAIDSGGNVYVAGSATYNCFEVGFNRYQCAVDLNMNKYDVNGKLLWNVSELRENNQSLQNMQAAELVLGNGGNNVYLLANDSNDGVVYCTGQWYVHAAFSSLMLSA